MPHVQVALKSVAAVVAVGAGATGVAYLLYYFVMNTLGAVRAAGVTLLVPITAVFWGVVLLHESLSWTIVIGMAGILARTRLPHVRKRPLPEVAGPADAASR